MERRSLDSMPRRSTLRSNSSLSLSSCINCALTEQESICTPGTSQSTPPACNNDTYSVRSSNILEPGKALLGLRRVRRARTSVHNYNENVLSGSVRRDPNRRAPKRRSVCGRSGISIGQTSRSEEIASRMQLMNYSTRRRHIDWHFESMHGDEVKELLFIGEYPERQPSVPLNVLERDSGVVKSAQEKKSRRTWEYGMRKTEGLNWGSNLSQRVQTDRGLKIPAEKVLRTGANIKSSKRPQIEVGFKTIVRPNIKRWLLQGLYVGQERDFDPRLTESKNKLKRASAGERLDRPGSILPLPMFAGQRTLEIGRNFQLPFDVFSPLSPGQPKPEEWRKTQKSQLSSPWSRDLI